MIEDANHAIRDFALHIHLHHWHPISTVPCNQDVELRIAEEGMISTLEFPCQLTNAGDWINVDLSTRIEIEPVEWRVWQHNKSSQPHHSQVSVKSRVALPQHGHWNAEPGIEPKRAPVISPGSESGNR